MKFEIENWRWAGVPFYIRTGKRLATRATQISVHFKPPPFALFRDTPVERLTPNVLTIHVAPDEGVSLQFGAKIPGPVVHLGPVHMDFRYADYFGSDNSTGYETLLYDVLIGDSTLFQRADNVEAGWAAVQPLLDAWAGSRGDVQDYAAGSMGPEAADALLARDGRRLGQTGMTDIKLLLADVDGTLVTHDKVLTPRAIAAVHALHDRDIMFAVTSGRPPKGMAMLFSPLKIDTPIAGFNGGLFTDTLLTTIESHTLPTDVAKQAAAIIAKHKLSMFVYRGEDWLVLDPHGPHVERESWTVKFAPKVVDGFDDVMDGVVKLVGVSDDLEAVAAAETEMQAALGKTASAARSQPYYLDVTHPDANKGGVVAYLARRYALDPKHIATIGDMPNDTLMFKPSGLSIAMGQASDAVKAAATKVTASSEKEGFAKAVEDFLLA